MEYLQDGIVRSHLLFKNLTSVDQLGISIVENKIIVYLKKNYTLPWTRNWREIRCVIKYVGILEFAFRIVYKRLRFQYLCIIES